MYHLSNMQLFSDASFTSNSDLTSQLGNIVTLADTSEEANLLHYFFVKSKRVTRSVFAAELFAFVHEFDYVSTLRLH